MTWWDCGDCWRPSVDLWPRWGRAWGGGLIRFHGLQGATQSPKWGSHLEEDMEGCREISVICGLEGAAGRPQKPQ